MIKTKLEREIAERLQIQKLSEKPLANNNRRGKAPTFTTMSVSHLGEVGAGRVIPFEPSSDFSTVVLPAGSRAENFGTVTVRGLSLTKLGIFDGDKLLVRYKFSWSEITEKTVCIVYIHSTGELVAKRIIRGANMLILRASGGGIPDKEVSPDDVEIRALAIDVQRPISECFRLASWNGEGDA